jgi:site-specific DNA-methyltransferase (adenine-specific)
MSKIRILVGDMRERLRELPDASIDSVVTDPPYHLTSIVKRFGSGNAAPNKVGKTGAYARVTRGFMGQTWDGGDVAFQAETWAEVLRMLKPGGHMVAFSGTRTYHRMVVAIEDAGFEIRDQLAWIYGSGFPKSHNLDGEWEGWGTALKPAWEPICLARKPLVGTVAGNVLMHGTGAINIDSCRVGDTGARNNGRQAGTNGIYGHIGSTVPVDYDKGRFPANVLHDGSDEVVAAFPDSEGQRSDLKDHAATQQSPNGIFNGMRPALDHPARNDSGSAARFFYSGKASKEDRGEGNTHPTVKPVEPMRWLIRLVTPPGGTVLDPFAGSGSTLVAADMEQVNAIGIELSPDYAAIAERRLRQRAGMFAEVTVE